MGPRERQRRRRAKTHTVPVVIFSFFAFMLVAGLAFGVGMIGNVNRWLQDLPDYTNTDEYLVSEPTNVLDSQGNKIATFYAQNRKTVESSEISPYVLQGTIDVEDERFYEHGGIDLWGIARAAAATLTGGHEGASTITQQLVRNTILSDEQFTQSIERKVREAYIAIKMEEIYSKDEILNMYLNTIYYGHGAYGIEAASQTYFSKSANELTLPEAALLIGLPNSPSLYDPTQNPELSKSRRNKVLDNMLRLGHITQEQHDEAQAAEIELNVTETSSSGIEVYSQPYFVDYVRKLLGQEFSTDVIFKGGLTVKTTIDPTYQSAAEQAVNDTLSEVGLSDLQAGVVAIDPKTGYIKAMVGGRNYYADENHINYATAKRQTGSSFKAITLAAAISEGMNPNITLNCTSPVQMSSTWKVQNFGNHNYGYISLKRATEVSSNTGYVQVADAVGNESIIKTAKAIGLKNVDFLDTPAMTLGTSSISPLEMAGAFATFAAGGEQRDTIAITEITSRTGETLYKHEDSPTQALAAEDAQAVNEVLSGVVSNGTATSARLSVNQPVAGKTGTTEKTDNLWFCGYTPQISVAVWTGYNSGETIKRNGSTLGTSNIPQPIFRRFCNTILQGIDREEFPTTDVKPEYKDNSEWKLKATNTSKSYSNSSNSNSTTTTTTTTTTTEESAQETTSGGTGGTGGNGGTGGTGGNSGTSTSTSGTSNTTGGTTGGTSGGTTGGTTGGTSGGTSGGATGGTTTQ